MKGFLRILLYIVLLGLCVVCVKGFLLVLQAGMDRAERRAERQYEEFDPGRVDDSQAPPVAAPAETPLADGTGTNGTVAAAPTNRPPATGGSDNSQATKAAEPEPGKEAESGSRLGLYAAGGLLSLLGLALLLADDISRLAARSTHRWLEGVEEGEEASREYEEAERLWANADYLGAVHVLREFLKKHPRRVHAHFRIAEIYERDLRNTLAAALEHEEILRFRLDEERWGWAAIHLCNLYYHLNQPEKAEALLHRIVNEYGHTVAAGKARKRLGLSDDGDGDSGTPGGGGEETSGSPEPSGGFQLPRGFRPK